MTYGACLCGHESEEHFQWNGECLHEENDTFCGCEKFTEAQ